MLSTVLEGVGRIQAAKPHIEDSVTLRQRRFLPHLRSEARNRSSASNVSTGGAGEYVIGVVGEDSTGTYSVFIEEITCPS